MKRNNKLGNLNLREASEYYDDHDIFDGKDVIEVKNFSFRISKKKYVGLEEALFNKIRDKAKKLRVNEEELIQSWLEEKVARNL